jgi:hypothetical protein
MRADHPTVAIRYFRILKLPTLLLALSMIAAACSGSSTDSDDGGTASDAVEASDADSGEDDADSESDSDSGSEAAEGDGAVASEELSSGAPDPEFDYSVVNYDLESADSALRGDRQNPVFPPPVIEPSLIRSGGVPRTASHRSTARTSFRFPTSTSWKMTKRLSSSRWTAMPGPTRSRF